MFPDQAMQAQCGCMKLVFDTRLLGIPTIQDRANQVSQFQR